MFGGQEAYVTMKETLESVLMKSELDDDRRRLEHWSLDGARIQKRDARCVAWALTSRKCGVHMAKIGPPTKDTS